MDLENILLSEGTQSQMAKHMNIYMKRSEQANLQRQEADQRLPKAGMIGGQEWGAAAHGTGFLFGLMKMF